MYNNGNSSKNVTGASVVDGSLDSADFPDNGLSGNKIDGGTISNFTSTGIDDNATSTAITINSAEDVGIGTVAPLAKLSLGVTSPNVAASKIAVYDNAGANFWGMGFTSYSSVLGLGLYAGATLTGVPDVNITTDGDVTVETGNLVIGTSGKGIDFSATAGTGTSELLDDYEEGTFTPTLDSGTNITYTSRSGRYTKIGNVVYCTAELVVSNSDSDGSNVSVGSLPFTGNFDEEAVNATLGRYTSFLGAKATSVTNFRFTGAGVLLMEGSSSLIAYSEVASSGTLQIAFTYTT